MKRLIEKILLQIPAIKRFNNLINETNKINQELIKDNSVLNYKNSILFNENTELKKTIFQLNQYRYQYIVHKLREKVQKGEKIRVGFLIMYDAIFPYKPLYERMLKDKLFDPFIVIVPDISRGEDHLKASFNQAYNYFTKKYNNVFKGYDLKNNVAIDYSSKMDMVCFPNPYNNMTDPVFEIQHYLDKNILPFYINYSFSVTKFSSETLKSDFYSYIWKIFIPTNSHLDELKNQNLLGGKNAIVVGYCKMDDLAKQKIIKKKRKVIILAPHHTIIDWKALKISNFLKYADLFLNLPKLYPNIDFIFRPHPLLAFQLGRPEIWGKEKADDYFKKMENYPNVVYSRGGDYFNIFANSDGMIHDCGSFLAEYLFTGKPTCYMLKDKNSIKKWFLPYGQKCIEQCYKAFSEEAIINFIDNVIIKGIDDMKENRVKFVNSNLKINYPIVSKDILKHIKLEIIYGNNINQNIL